QRLPSDLRSHDSCSPSREGVRDATYLRVVHGFFPLGAGIVSLRRQHVGSRTASTTSRIEFITSCGCSIWIAWPLFVSLTYFALRSFARRSFAFIYDGHCSPS